MKKESIKENIVSIDFPRLCVIRNNKGPCVLTVLAAVARYYGKEFTPGQFEYLFKLADISPGLDEKSLWKYMAPLGIRVETRNGATVGDIRSALEAGIPCAVAFSPLEDSHGGMNMGGGHMAAVVGIGEKHIYLADSIFCEGQVVDSRSIERFEKRWFTKDQIGYPDYIPSPDDKTFGTLILFHGGAKAEGFESVWKMTPVLRSRYRRQFRRRWTKRGFENAIKACEESERFGERRDREILAVGGWAEQRKWLKARVIASGDLLPDGSCHPCDEPVTLELSPEDLAELDEYGRKLEAIAAIKPIEYYECYLKGEPLPITAGE